MMKHLRRFGLAAVALLGLTMAASCGKDEEKATNNEIPDLSVPSLAGTSWRGTYSDVLQHNGSHQLLFTWTLDFNDEGTGKVLMEVTSPVIEEIVEDFDMTYTYDGASRGELKYMGFEYEYTSDFLVDGINRTMDANLWMHFRLSEADTVGEGTVFGGRTTLHQVQ